MSELVTPRPGLYLCTRTSGYSDDQPCEEAFRVKIVAVDRRVVDDPKKIGFYHGRDEWWYSEGTNHRIENGNICRDLGVMNEWAVELDDFESLKAFIEKYRRVIIERNKDGFMCIEIYDARRE